MVYDWELRMIRYAYPFYSYTETYSFNTQRGFDGNFEGQKIYKVGADCGVCDLGTNLHSMFSITPSLATQKFIGTTVVGGNTIFEYEAIDPYAGIEKIWFINNQTVSKILFVDTTSYYFWNVSQVNSNPALFPLPPNCFCNEAVDVVAVLDVAITTTDWNLQKGFLQNFTSTLAIGPSAVNFAMISFGSEAEVRFNIYDGDSRLNTQHAVDKLGCCDEALDSNNPLDICCCCGHSISAGLGLAATQIDNNFRPQSKKILLVITDGSHTHDVRGNICSNVDICKSDLAETVAAVKTTVPGIAIVVVAIGATTQSQRDIISILTNQTENILSIPTYSELSNVHVDVAAIACGQPGECGICCGFCACQRCYPPQYCDSFDSDPPCVTATKEDLSFKGAPSICCEKRPIDCYADPCVYGGCNLTSGECNTQPIDCPNSPSCATYTRSICNATRPGCAVSGLSCAPGQLLCGSSQDCEDGSPITNNECNNGLCVTTMKSCVAPSTCHTAQWTSSGCVIEPIDCDDRDECTVDACIPGGGCIHSVRNCTVGGTACTLGSKCDRFIGCITTPRKCFDDDICTNNECDPVLGCRFPQVKCVGSDPCSVYYCDSDQGCLSKPLCERLVGSDNCTVQVCNATLQICFNDSSKCQGPPGPINGGCCAPWVWALAALGVAIIVIAALVLVVCGSKKATNERTERV